MPGLGPAPGFDDPVGFLRAAHRRLEAQLATLDRIAAALRAGDPAAPAALAGPLAWFADEGYLHSMDEEGSLFPRVAESPATGELAAEHRQLEAIFLAIRDVAGRLPDPALAGELATHLAAFTSAYREHLRREEAEVFPAAAQLDPAQLRAIGIELRVRRG